MTPEGRVKEAIKKCLHKHGFVRAGSSLKDRPADPKGWYYMPVQNGMGVSGIPDFVGCWLGRFFSIEAKAPGKSGNTSVNQDRNIADIRVADGIALVIDDVELLEEFFDEQCTRT